MEALISTGERILIIQTAFLGDAILTLPMIQFLKERYPHFVVDVLSIPSTEEVFLASPSVDNVIVIDKKNKHKGFRALNKFVRELKANQYSRVYSPHKSLRSAYITLNLGIIDTYGFDNSSLKYAYKNVTAYNYKHHEVRRNLSLISNDFDDFNWKILPEINVNENQKIKVNELIQGFSLKNSFIAIAPGSVWKTKRYPAENYEQVIRSLIENNEQIVLIGGSDDELYCDEIKSKFNDHIVNFAGKLCVAETVFLLSMAKLLITNDSAPTHLGMCADIPVLTLFCSTVSGFGFYPYNGKSSSLSFNDLDCKPCGIHGHQVCPVKTFDCGNKLSPEIVVTEVKRIINGNEKTN